MGDSLSYLIVSWSKSQCLKYAETQEINVAVTVMTSISHAQKGRALESRMYV